MSKRAAGRMTGVTRVKQHRTEAWKAAFDIAAVAAAATDVLEFDAAAAAAVRSCLVR